MRVVADTLFAGLLLCAIGWWIFVARPNEMRARLDPVYAQDVFASLIDGAVTLESRAFHAPQDQGWGCSFAIVELPADAPQTPPTRRGDGVPWYESFGGSWEPTPVAVPPCDNCRDALRFCASNWPALGARLVHVTQASGAWVSQDPVGETIDIWAPQAGLAAHIRFGD